MRHIFFFLGNVSLLIFIMSCSNDFQLVEGGQVVPVVYGVISSKDTASYIRVEKAFIDENIGGDVLAKDAANLYFEDVNVKLRHLKSGEEFTLQKVDGNLEGFKRDEGAFASAPNYLYKIKRSELNLIPKDEYKLIISKNDGSVLTEASTKILTPLSDDNNDVEPRNTATFSFSYTSDFRVTWFPDENSVIHDVILIINYTEILNGLATEKSVTWKAGINTSDKIATSNSYTFVTKGRAFYEFMASELPPSGPNNPVTRVFKDITFKIISGGQPIKDLIRLGQANLGITSSGEIPTYTNMSNGAIGIFTSKTEFVREGVGIARVSLDSLRNGVITKNLNFK
jgi:hypothetical protein